MSCVKRVKNSISMNFKGRSGYERRGKRRLVLLLQTDSPDLFTLHLVNETSNNELKQHSGPTVRLTTAVILATL